MKRESNTETEKQRRQILIKLCRNYALAFHFSIRALVNLFLFTGDRAGM